MDEADELLTRIGALIRQIAPRADPVGREPLADLQRRLGRPLQLAVAGEVSSGKSSLVNALIGRPLAVVKAGETAQVTTFFRYGESPRAQRIGTAARQRVAPADDGRLPLAPAGHLVAELPAELLTETDLIDTPGLYSGDDEAGHSERGRRALFGADGRPRPAVAEATLFVLSQATSAKVVATLTALRDRDVVTASGVGSLAVFNAVDDWTGGGDPMLVARELARQARNDLRGLVADAVPVNGLLATAALPGVLDSRSLDLLAALGARRRAVEPVRPPDLEADAEEAERIVETLGPYGAGWVAARLSRDPDRSTLGRDLRRRSGMPALIRAIRERLLAHAPLLKAAAALSELDRLARSPALAAPAVRQRLALGVREMLRHRSLHRLAEIRTRDLIAAAPPGGLGTDSRRRLDQLLSPGPAAARLGVPQGTGPRQLYRLVVREQRRWMTIAARDQALDRIERPAVRTALRTLALLTDSLAPGPSPAEPDESGDNHER